VRNGSTAMTRYHVQDGPTDYLTGIIAHPEVEWIGEDEQ